MVFSSQIFRRKKWRGDHKIRSCLQSRKQMHCSIFHFSCLTLYYIWIIWRVWFGKDWMCCLKNGKFSILWSQDKCLGYCFSYLMPLYLLKQVELNEGPLVQFSHMIWSHLLESKECLWNWIELFWCDYGMQALISFLQMQYIVNLICFVCLGYCFGLSSVRVQVQKSSCTSACFW